MKVLSFTRTRTPTLCPAPKYGIHIRYDTFRLAKGVRIPGEALSMPAGNKGTGAHHILMQPAYTEGKMVFRNGRWVRQLAKFRCDGFVIYSYLAGLDHNISRNPQTPKRIWNGLPFNYSWDRGV